jgi:hypothetical protein
MNPMIATELLEAAGECRRIMSRKMAELPINGLEYQAIDRIIHEIDSLADVLTGNREHFWLKPHS